MKAKILAVILLVTSIGLISNAYAHTSSVVGDYKVEVGWDKEPPIAGMVNKVTVMITYATADEKETDEEMDHSSMEHEEGMSHDEMENEEHDEMEHEEHGEVVTGLASGLDVTITLNNEKTTLTMVEDEDMPGLYMADYTPSASGFPVVHFFTEIEGEPIEVDFHPEKVEDGALIQTMTGDSSVNIDVIATAPKQDDGMLINVAFTDEQGNPIAHVNYDIIVTQNGEQVFSETKSHSREGNSNHSTEDLASDDPVDIQIEILGIGLPAEEANWSGPAGETVSVSIVPEFGPIAMLVFAAATVSIVGMAAKSKIIPRL